MIFFLGIKGAGMAALACMLYERGEHVEGSDLEKHFFTEEKLKQYNIKCHPFGVFPEDGTEPDQPIDIDKYSKQITEKLLDILSELSENSRQEELERVIDMKGY